MMIVRNKRIGYLTTTPSPGHPNWPRTNHWTPPPQSSHLLLVRQIWFPPQIGHTLDHWWITWWSRESALSSRARVTSLNSHCEVHLPSAKDIYLNETCWQITSQRRHVHTRDLLTWVRSYWLPFTLTHSITPCCLVNLFDVTLACKDVNSKLVRIVTVADADSEKGVDDSLVQTWKMKFSHKINFLSRLWAQGLVKIEVEVQAQFWGWSLVNILLLILGWDYEDYSW